MPREPRIEPKEVKKAPLSRKKYAKGNKDRPQRKIGSSAGERDKYANVTRMDPK